MTATLDVTKPPEVRYAIEPWLRDEQIKHAIQRVTGRIQPHDTRDEPIAIVGFGPSLNDTWEQIRNFKYVMTCSGAHKFLREKGITPQWHVEVDPRSHKVGLMGEPCRDTTYLIASTCHPKVFEHLDGYDVQLWHVFDSTEEGQRILPRGEWAVTGGCDVGLRALTLAAFLGFRDLHVFGLDGSARETRHAGPHPNSGKAKHYAETEYDGVTYKTTPAMLAAAQQVRHEMEQMPKVKATFYGEGLIQHMMRDYQPKADASEKPLANQIAYARPEVISAEYASLNAQLHRDNLAYGVGGGKHAHVVKKLCDTLKTTSVLDYGCGKGYLAKELPFPIWQYDPAIPEHAATPRPADVVVCSDVLEHIEPDKLAYVLDDLRRCTLRVGYFVIHTGASSKSLADGRNAHLIQQGRVWWKNLLKKFFVVGKIEQKGPLLYAVVGPKPLEQKVAA